MTTRFIMQTLIFNVISVDFLSLSRRPSSWQNFPAARSKDKRLFSQASFIVNFSKIGLLSFPKSEYGWLSL